MSSAAPHGGAPAASPSSSPRSSPRSAASRSSSPRSAAASAASPSSSPRAAAASPSSSTRATAASPSSSTRATATSPSSSPRAAAASPSSSPRTAAASPSSSPRAAASSPYSSPRTAAASPSSSPRAAASSSAAAVATARCYFCHRCFLATRLPAGTACPLCDDTFLEEIDIPPTQNPNIDPNIRSFVFIPSLSLSPASFVLRSPADITALFHSEISPLRPLNTHGLGFESDIERVISPDNCVHAIITGVPPPISGPSLTPWTADKLRDFAYHVFGTLRQEGNDLFGSPTLESAIAALPDIEIAGGTAASAAGEREAWCMVCMEEFKVGDRAKQLPCDHVFHRDCILTWLELRNTCPGCRFELPKVFFITAVFIIVIMPPWADPAADYQRPVMVEERVLGRLILGPIQGAEGGSNRQTTTETSRGDSEPQ